MSNLTSRDHERIGLYDTLAQTAWAREGMSLPRFAYAAVTLLLAAAAAYAYVHKPHGPGAAWWITGALAVVLLWALSELIRAKIHHRALPAIVATPAPPTQVVSTAASPTPLLGESVAGQPPERILLQSTASELIAHFKNRTGLEGQRLIAPYLGKWMEVSGTLQNVWRPSAIGEWLQVSIEEWSDNPVVMFFESTWFDRLSTLTRGRSITVRGRVQKVSEDAVVLDPCELVDPP